MEPNATSSIMDPNALKEKREMTPILWMCHAPRNCTHSQDNDTCIGASVLGCKYLIWILTKLLTCPISAKPRDIAC